MEVSEVRQKAKELKETIEEALKKFRTETGYIPDVKVETNTKRTNTANFTTQKVNVTITM